MSPTDSEKLSQRQTEGFDDRWSSDIGFNASDHLLRVGCTVGLRRHSGIDPRAIRREFLTRTQARRTLAKKLKWNRLLRDDLQMQRVEWRRGFYSHRTELEPVAA